MPIYEYQCSTCGHTLEALQKVTDELLTDCPVCHTATLAKLVSASSFQLKGTGWYATDFKTKSPQEKPVADSAAAPTATADKSETKTDTTTKPSTKDAASE